MSHREVKSSKQLSTEVDLLTDQLAWLTDEVVNLRREQRANLDGLTLELASIKGFITETHPDLADRFNELREQVRLELNPE